MAHILVVDDEESILDSVGRMLARLGHDVEIAHDGQEAVDLVTKIQGVECVITDINMPGIDGYEVANRIRKLGNPDTPVIAISGSAENAVRSNVFNASLLKPFKLRTLVQVVESLV
jgi:CheY-like chemotaxis protein